MLLGSYVTLVVSFPNELDYGNPSFLRWIPHDLGSNRFNTSDFQLGVLAKRSVTESNAYPFVSMIDNKLEDSFISIPDYIREFKKSCFTMYLSEFKEFLESNENCKNKIKKFYDKKYKHRLIKYVGFHTTWM